MRQIWANGLPNQSGSPKSGHRMAAVGMQFPWRWDGDTISTNLDCIWGISVYADRAVMFLGNGDETRDLFYGRNTHDWVPDNLSPPTPRWPGLCVSRGVYRQLQWVRCKFRFVHSRYSETLLFKTHGQAHSWCARHNSANRRANNRSSTRAGSKCGCTATNINKAYRDQDDTLVRSDHVRTPEQSRG